MKGKEVTKLLQKDYFRFIVYLLVIGVAVFAFRDQIFDATNEKDAENTTVETCDETNKEHALMWAEESTLMPSSEISWSDKITYLPYADYVTIRESSLPAEVDVGCLRINIETFHDSVLPNERTFSKVVFYDAGGDALGTVEHTFPPTETYEHSSTVSIDLEENGFEDARTVKLKLFNDEGCRNSFCYFKHKSGSPDDFPDGATTFEYLVLE